MKYKAKNNYTKKESMSMPWIESPFFDSILNDLNVDDEMKIMAQKYNKNGYLVLDLGLDDETILKINQDVDKIIKSKSFEGQEKYEYTDHRRLFQAWKKSQSIKNLTKNENILKTLRFLYNREPLAFSTINFTNPTSQPLHSDTIHFNSYPKGWMVGVWVAFEDCDASNGTIRVIKGSHKWKEYDYNSINIQHPDNRENGEKKSYRDYDEFVKNLVVSKKAKEESIIIKKGQAIIWSANLLHGGTPVKNDNISRNSQAIHYFFHGCKKYYTPMFSEPMLGVYAEKWCNEKENIFTFKGEE